MKLDSSDSDEMKAGYKLVPRNTCIDYPGTYKIISADEETGTVVVSIKSPQKDGTIAWETKTIEFGMNGLRILRR